MIKLFLEMTLQVLPPVPPVNVTLQPEHQTQPVGVILSVRSHYPVTKDQLEETSNAHTFTHMHRYQILHVLF